MQIQERNLARAIEHESSGNSAAAYGCYQKAVDISPAIAYELIQVLPTLIFYWLWMQFLLVNYLCGKSLKVQLDLMEFFSSLSLET